MIRWPQDALIFSVRVRGCGVYAAGYVEGDTSTQEILAARQTEQGLELVSLRGARGGFAELSAVRSLSTDGVAPVLDAFIPLGSLQPMSVSSLGAAERVVVVERLPADVHLADLSRQLFRKSNGGARPPVGLALYIAREVARIYAAAPTVPLDDDRHAPTLRLTRRADNVLLAWDGAVHVQPRVAVVEPGGVELFHHDWFPDESVAACGHHLLRLLCGELPDVNSRDPDERMRAGALATAHADALGEGDIPVEVRRLVRHIAGFDPMKDGSPPMGLAEVIKNLDELLVHEPFSRADLAGTLAQLFAEERAQDLAFREEVAACDLDALTLPEVRALDADADALAVLDDPG